jgi:hypothetical protein
MATGEYTLKEMGSGNQEKIGRDQLAGRIGSK